ncbi:MAG TPA: UvrD-helicase domain-containing protein [Limnochordia bacterium]|nr:UvrD-helicase domain-containing protein [Limnochordia bacterium]HPU64676.1 UvrD-helicase domain-containing protein [Limnochordia bacterium]
MAFKPTDSQRKAIVTIDRPVAVVAGAGSGKTWVLVERYLHLLDQGFATDEIAAITFTKKAAQEMKERLREARPQLAASLERAQISTIHSLCQRIIQEHPLQARLDPRFRVGEEWETRLLLAEVIEEIVAETEIPTELGTAGEVSALVLDLYEKMLSKGDLRFQRSFPEPLGEFPLQELEHRTEQVLRLTPSTPRQGEVLEQLAEEWPYLRELLRLGDADLRLEALEILQKLVGGIRGKLAEHTAALKVLIASAQQIITEGRGRVILTYLGEVLQRVHGLYSERKRLGGLVDFGDLERLTCQLLEDPQVVADYPFKHIMVDEFQDTNPLQKRIVDAFTAQGAVLFVVGDPKQSIYRFRGAEVGVFVQTQREVAETGKGIFLETNFRSRPELIKFCNQFFHRLLAGEPIGFEPSEADKPAAGRPCVSILLTPAEALSADEARAAEAEQIALQIQELVEGGRYKYEDISILFRATTSMYIYEQALKKAGIPYVNLSGRGFYAKQEIQDVLHYFRWLEDSGDEVAKMAVLRSPFYLLSDEGLYWLRRGELDRLTPKEQEALARAEEDYSALQLLAKHQPAPVVIGELLRRTGYVEKTWRLPFGPQKVANIEKLLEQSWDLFARDVYTVPEQVRYLRLLAREAHKEGEAQLDAEHADVVILRTIHNAKGLEFPVVFLADTNAGAVRTQGGKVLYHPEFGLVYREMADYELARGLDRAEEASEAKRLLYVAVTRAQEEFFWCARTGKAGKDSWWSWFQEHQPHIDQDCYQIIPGELPPLQEGPPQGEPARLELPEYAPLAPQYVQVPFSVTALMNYDLCPRYYYLRHILGLPERGRAQSAAPTQGSLSATQRGTIVHRVVEQIKDPKELSRLVQDAAAVEGVTLTSRQQAQLEEIIQPYLASPFFQRVQAGAPGRLYKEHNFFIPAGSFLINGLVDQVYVGEEGVEVVDFKTNWIEPGEVPKVGDAYRVQLRLYAWATAREFRLPAVKAQAYFLIPNSLYDLEPELLDADQTEAWLVDTCRRIIDGAEIGAEAFPPAAKCALCSERSYCLHGLPAGKVGVFGETTDLEEDLLEEELR